MAGLCDVLGPLLCFRVVGFRWLDGVGDAVPVLDHEQPLPWETIVLARRARWYARPVACRESCGDPAVVAGVSGPRLEPGDVDLGVPKRVVYASGVEAP